jgi:hypothetical protein
VEESQFAPGKWTLEVQCAGVKGSTPSATYGPTDASGVLLFTDDSSISATAQSFFGNWEYWCNGVRCTLTVLKDGSVTATRDGAADPDWDHGSWQCDDGILSLQAPGLHYPEFAILRDGETLSFVNLPYPSARRVQGP